MGAAQKVELAPEPWCEEYRALLARVAPDHPRWLDGVIGAIERGDAVLFVARRDGKAVGVLVLAFQPWPIKCVYILAMAVVPKSGFAWSAALWPRVQDLARRAGAEETVAHARTQAQLRLYRRLGLRPRSTTVAAPC